MKKCIELQHICSPEQLFNILETKIFRPKFNDRSKADSGLNCFIIGRKYSILQHANFGGYGARLLLKWEKEIKEVNIDHPFPLEKNTLYSQEAWRTIIPFGTDKELIKVVGFKISDEDYVNSNTDLIERYNERLKRKPIYLSIGKY